MATYQATIRHHSISHARTISIYGTLMHAKRRATTEFGDEQPDYEIVIAQVMSNGEKIIVSTRLVGKDRWTNA